MLCCCQYVNTEVACDTPGATWSAIWSDIQQNWWIYLSMPVIAAFIGYVTKLLAVWMMFNPIEFKGKRIFGKPILGWQGMIPSRAGKMAAIAYDTLTDNILDFQELIGRLDPEDLVRELREPINEAVEDITEELTRDVHANMLFRPREPKKFLGIAIHGRMHMRRDEIAPAYGDLIA